MLKTISIGVLLALFLAACSVPSTVTPEPGALPAASPTAGTVSTATQEAAGPAPEGTSSPADPGTSGGIITYHIVTGESQLAYEVGETFFNQDNRFNVAIGTTTEINGEIRLDPANPQLAEISPITADISRFSSDSARRDQAIRDRFIETSRYPMVTFTPTGISGLPETYTPGEEIHFTVEGEVTIRETTRPAAFEVVARLEGDDLVGTATTIFRMSDFDFGPIQIAGILGTEDEVKISLSFLARP